MAAVESDDSTLVWRLAHGDGGSLGPLMERWGDPLLETRFRAARDPHLSLDLYAQVCAEGYLRLRYGTVRRPTAFGPWAVDVIGDVLATAASEARIPTRARSRMKLPALRFSGTDIERLNALRDPRTLHDARERLPRDFSAAADRMLLDVPSLVVLSRIHPSPGDASQ